MRLRSRTKLNVEALEDRSVPAVTAGVVNGSLVITGDPAAASHLVITASDTNADKVADTFKVTDGSATVGTFGGVTQDLILRLGKEDDAVTIDLGGLTAPRDVGAYLGGGVNSLTVINGTVKGSLSVQGGVGANVVTLGGAAALTIDGHVSDQVIGPANGMLELKGSATVKGDLFAENVRSLKLDAGSMVSKNVIDMAGPGPDSLSLAGSVGGSVFAFLGRGKDSAVIGGTVAGDVVLNGGFGKDTLTLSGKVGGRTIIIGGGGGDAVTVTATARLKGPAHIRLGRGNDTLTLNDSATVSAFVARGGPGANTFVGNKARPGLTLKGF